ncbi:MAG: hypothetical protein R3A45_04830 [Bdellovibrionota bacterium]
MRELDYSIMELVKAKQISPIMGLRYANNPKSLREEYQVQGIEI